MSRNQIKALCVMVTSFSAAAITHTWGVSGFIGNNPRVPFVCIIVCTTILAFVEER